MEARLHLRQGRAGQAARWAEICGLNPGDGDLPYARLVEYLTLARVLTAQGNLEAVGEMLEHLLEKAEADQRTGDVIEILVLRALLASTLRNQPQALRLLERAMELAGPEGYVRTFLDEGEPMRSLLVDFHSLHSPGDGRSPRVSNYAGQLLAAFSGADLAETPRQEALVEPLSERELDILRLIATGRTNQEIAEILVIALSTVKSHINHLYGKVGVHNRVQAIAAAREMGLLPE